MLTIAVLGALLITGEYATGSIRSTFAAVPTRIPVLAAKALTLVVLTAAVTLVSVTLSYFVTMPQLSQYDLVPALDDPGTWRVFGGSPLLPHLRRPVLARRRHAPTLHRCQPDRCPDRAAAARHPQLHPPGLGRDHRQLPTAAGVLSVAHHRSSRDQGAYLSTQASEPDRDGRLRCRPYRGGCVIRLFRCCPTAGVPLEEISQLVGHSGTTVTELVYRHQLKPVIQTGATVMDRLFGA
jgi:hypothetical protein